MITVLIYKIDLREDLPLLDSIIGSLPPEIFEAIRRFVRLEDRLRAAIGKALLAFALKRCGRAASALAELRYTEYHKPYFDFDFHFNISHSSEYVVLAYSNNCELGIDIERVVELDINDFEDQLTAEERESINSAHSPAEKFFSVWTCKESIVKALGMGLHAPLAGIDTMRPAGDYAGRPLPKTAEIAVVPGYKCSLAYFGERDAIEVERINREQVLSIPGDIVAGL